MDCICPNLNILTLILSNFFYQNIGQIKGNGNNHYGSTEEKPFPPFFLQIDIHV
jgi:hypothetical protein